MVDMAEWLDTLNHSLCDNILLNINDYGYMERVMELMGPNHQTFKKNMTIMHFCIYSDDINVVKMILNSGGDPNIKDCNGISPTDLCVILKRSEDYLELLVSYGGKLNFFLAY